MKNPYYWQHDGKKSTFVGFATRMPITPVGIPHHIGMLFPKGIDKTS
jgi:hypothetical protein